MFFMAAGSKDSFRTNSSNLEGFQNVSFSREILGNAKSGVVLGVGSFLFGQEKPVPCVL